MRREDFVGLVLVAATLSLVLGRDLVALVVPLLPLLLPSQLPLLQEETTIVALRIPPKLADCCVRHGEDSTYKPVASCWIARRMHPFGLSLALRRARDLSHEEILLLSYSETVLKNLFDEMTVQLRS
jgi:hypothetical protein